jgi:hypothetical protein
MRCALVAAAALLAAGGCSFSGSRADAFRCEDGRVCPDGLSCVGGICVHEGPAGDASTDTSTSSDAAHDAQATDGSLPDGPSDSAPQSDVVTQNDSQVQNDTSSPDDALPGCTPVTDSLQGSSGHFQVVRTAGQWATNPNEYRQRLADDLQVSWVPGSGGGAVSISVQVAVTTSGNDGFTTPGEALSVAGVMVRAQNLAQDSITGYLCGVDSRGSGRLVLGRMSGSYTAGSGTLTVLGTQPMGVPTWTYMPVEAQAAGNAISCSSGDTHISINDTNIASGSVALFTIGTMARFKTAQYCVP